MEEVMTTKELEQNGNHREAILIGKWKGPNGEFEISMLRDLQKNIMRLVFVVGDTVQEVDTTGQLRIERAIEAGLFVRL